MHPLKFDALFPFVSTPTPAPLLSVFSGGREALRIFDYNFGLVIALGMVPGYSFMNGELWHLATMEAAFELKITDPQEFQDSPALAKRASEIFEKHEMMPITEGHYAHFAEASKNAVEINSAPGKSDAHSALHGVLKAMIVQGWTSIEVGLELVIKAIHSQRPTLLASITPKELKECGFRSRAKLAKYFAYTFRSDNAAIMSEIENDDINALALARHAIAHAAGKADGDFVKYCTPIPKLATLLASGTNGGDMQFDGEISRALLCIARPRFYALLTAVDEWVSTHP